MVTGGVLIGRSCDRKKERPGGRMSYNRGFDSQTFDFHVTTLNKLFRQTCVSVHEQYSLVLARGQWCDAALTLSKGGGN